jgi:hypothetical protein
MNVLSVSLVVVLAAVPMLSGIARADDDDTVLASRVQQGFAISPVPKNQLDLTGKSSGAVGLGSYLVNAAGDCSGCHSFPQFLPAGNMAGSNPGAGDPFSGALSSQSVSGRLKANYNVSHYLAGGQCFGPFMARNLTPGGYGPVEGLTEAEFIQVMRTGEDIHCNKFPADPICTLPSPPTPLLQVMPWPAYHNLTDGDLKAIYAYLAAVPAAEACNTVADGCPGASGGAANSTSYVYPNTGDCPNPAPPQ